MNLNHGPVTRLITCAFLLVLAGLNGCSNAAEGAVSGAGLGALTGLAIGSLSGDAGKGAAIGALAGGVGGAVVGDQNRRRDEATAKQVEAQAQAAQQPKTTTTIVTVSTPQQPYKDGQALGQLVGKWRVSGTIDGGSSGSIPVNGTAQGSIDKVYFLRLDMHFTDPRTHQPVDSTCMISQTGGHALKMTNSSSSSPELREFIGQMDQAGTVFSFGPATHQSPDRRIMIRINPTGGFTADVWQGDKRTDSYTFTAAT